MPSIHALPGSPGRHPARGRQVLQEAGMPKVETTFVSALIHSLAVQPLCDHRDTDELTPEQIAALHAYMHENLAAYYRLLMVVPEAVANRIISKRFLAAAAKLK
jgi:hypothetical protein